MLTIITTSAADSALQANMAAKNSAITITANPNKFQAGDTLVISDCENTDIFVASEVINSTTETTIKHSSNFEADGTTTQNSSDNLSKAYRDNAMILDRLGWEPSTSLRSGLEVTYAWVLDQVRSAASAAA